MPVKLATELWVQALVRRAQLGGAFATIARKGDPTAGAVLVKGLDVRARSARLWAEALRGEEGEGVWMQPHPGADEAELDAYAARQARYDPDLWIVEIEDADAARFLTEPVEPPAAACGTP